MEKQKIFTNTTFCVVGLSIVVLIVLTIFQHQQIKKSSGDETSETVTKDESVDVATPGPVETLQKNSTQRTEIAGIDKKISTDEIDELEYQLDAAEEELDTAHEQLSDELARKSEATKSARELYKKMFEDPAMKKRMRDSFRASIDSQYSPLLKELDLSPENLDQFKDLLSEEWADTVITLQSVLGVSSLEEKEAIQQRYDNIREEHKEKIQGFLGNEGYEKYQAYQDRSSERYIVTHFMESLNVEDKLNANQTKDLIDSMYEERIDVYSDLAIDENKLWFPFDIDDKEAAVRLQAIEQTYEGYAKSTGNKLPQSQLEQFKKYLQNLHENEEMEFKNGN